MYPHKQHGSINYYTYLVTWTNLNQICSPCAINIIRVPHHASFQCPSSIPVFNYYHTVLFSGPEHILDS